MNTVTIILLAVTALVIFTIVVRLNQLDTCLFDEAEKNQLLTAKVAELEKELHDINNPVGITESVEALRKQVRFDIGFYLGIIKDVENRVCNLEDAVVFSKTEDTKEEAKTDGSDESGE